ncbi:PaaI family thioesterase [Alphaproteobacteria bacterium]|nr:PaaI family thioesterase [Alphaproteobacteria bacterium]
MEDSAPKIDFLKGIRDFFEKGLGPAKDFSYSIIKCDADGATIDMPYQADLAISKADGAMHGAVLTTLVDTCLGMAALTKSASTRPIATVDLRVDFLRPSTINQDIRSHCTCYHLNGDLAFAEGTVIDKKSGEILLKAMGTFMLGTKGPDFSKLQLKSEGS